MVVMIGYVAFIGIIILKLTRRGVAWSARHQWSLATGALSFFILLSPIWEFATQRTDNTTGMTLVGFTAALFLLIIRLRIKRSTVAYNLD